MICACLYDVYDDGDEVYVQRTTYTIITRDTVRMRVDCMSITCDMTRTEWGTYHTVMLIDILLLCSLSYNQLGADGGRAIADALKINTTLTTLG